MGKVPQANIKASEKYKRKNYDRIFVYKGMANVIREHLKTTHSDESVTSFIDRAVKELIQTEDEMYGVTTDMGDYVGKKKKSEPEEPLYYSITTNPNELKSVDGTKAYPVAVRMANARGDGYYIAVYNDISGKRQYVLKKNEKGDWVKTDEFDV